MRKKLDGGARILLTRLQARGYGAYIVGGAVRDMRMYALVRTDIFK